MSNERNLSPPSSSVPPSSPRPLNLQAQTVGGIGILTSLQPEVERARIEHTLRHPEVVSAILSRVMTEAQACNHSTILDDEERACFDLLLASANCILGRSSTAKKDTAEAAKFFAESVKLFDKRASLIAVQRNASQLWTDYGIASYKTGSLDKAAEALTAGGEDRSAASGNFLLPGFVLSGTGCGRGPAEDS